MDEFWILVIVFIIVVIIAIWWVFKKGRGDNGQVQAEVPKHFIGEKIVVRNDYSNKDIYSFAVIGVRHTKQLNDHKTENMFVIVSIEWSNLWTYDYFMEGDRFNLKIDNSTYTISSHSVYLDNCLKYSGVESLGPGLSSKFDIVFEIPSARIDGEHILRYIDKSYLVDVEIILKNDTALSK